MTPLVYVKDRRERLIGGTGRTVVQCEEVRCGNEVHECGAAGEGRRRIHGETDYTHFDQIVQDTIYSD